MQTISLDEEIKLIDGVVFDINFFQDFSQAKIDEIVAEVKKPDEDYDRNDINYICSTRNYQDSKVFWENFERQYKKEKKREKKWRKKWKKGRKKRLIRARKIFGIKHLN